MKAEDGKEYVIFEFEIENNSDSDLSMSTIMCFEAYCNGYTCDLSLGAITYDNLKQRLDSTIAPDKKIVFKHVKKAGTH